MRPLEHHPDDPAFRAELTDAKRDLAASVAEPAEARRRVFEDLLAHSRGTVFAAEHGLARVRTIDDYREAVPLRSYAEYDPWLARSADGEPGVLTREEPRLFFTTSGSTGSRKRIPVTRPFLERVYLPYFRAAMGAPAEYVPDALSLGAATLNLRHDRLARPRTTGSGRPSLGPSQADLRGGFGVTLREPGSEAPWAELPVAVDEGDYPEKLYLRLRMAVEHDVRCVIGHNPALLAMVPELLVQWWPRILRDVREGTLGGRPGAAPDPVRAGELERGGPLPRAVWPRIRLLYCWTSGVASLYLPRLRELYGEDVTVLPTPQAASEGPVGVPLDRHPHAGHLAVSCALYEFVDAAKDVRPDSPTLLHEELEPGRDYHVVFSHLGGLYRYVLGDVTHVVDRVKTLPRVAYAGRAGLSDVAGERLREAQLVRAVASAAGHAGVDVVNLTARPERGAGTHRYAVAVAPHGAGPFDAVSFAGALDAELCRRSPDYRRAREDGRLAPARVLRVPPSAFVAHWHRRVAAGMRPPEVKDQVFQPDAAAWDLITAP
ncbi:GH3 auxin-responsive promoter family protein [Streptomyces sp. NPDC005900]|uniref:GH3 auxin-responsive promoter family protein n=1 Tax=Streptomyces sp. NPDC005900 TaxID=3154569 RepID=UPI003405F212